MLDQLARDAEAALIGGRIAEAEGLAIKALALREGDSRASLVLAKVEARTGRQEQAITRLEKILAADPEHFEATFWLSVLYRQRGSAEESIRFAEKAARRQPMEAHVFSNLGLSHLAAHHLPQAVFNLERSAELNPRVAQTFHHLGVAHQLQGKDDEAIDAFRRAIGLAPQSTDTLYFLGQSLMNRLDTAGAIGCAEKILQLKPQSATAHLLLANALIAENRTAEAEKSINHAIELDPKEGTAHAMLGMRLQGLGRIDQANASFRKSIELQPAQGFAYCALIRNHKVGDADAALVQQMERLIAEGGVPLRGLSFLHFGLGKAYEDLKQYELANRHFDEANRISYKLRFGESKFDRKRYSDSIDWTVRTYSKQFLRGNQPSGEGPDLPIFIVGMMRSGTTLVEQILSSHPEVAAGGEQQFWMRRGAEAIQVGKSEPDPVKLNRLAGEYTRVMGSLHPDALHITDKMPDNYLALGLIHMAFPNARIIHTRRNPIDTCISIYTTPNRTSDPYANDRENIVYAYEQYLKLMAHWREVLPPERLFEVNYEALVASPEPLTREMVAFCGLEWDDACLHPEDNERAVATPSVWQVRQPVYNTSVERWRRYEPWLGAFARLKVLG